VGGALYWFSPDGKKRYKISDHPIVAIVRMGSGVFAAEGLSLLRLSQGSIVRVQKRAGARRWVAKAYSKLPAAPEALVASGDGKLDLALAGSFVTVDARGRLTALHRNAAWRLLFPNSPMLESDGLRADAGMRQFVAVIPLGGEGELPCLSRRGGAEGDGVVGAGTACGANAVAPGRPAIGDNAAHDRPAGVRRPPMQAHRMPISAVHRLLIACACLAAAPAALADEMTLRALSSFPEGTFFSRNFERFIDKINKEGKGVLQIRYVGGPKAIPTMEAGNALRTGVVDIANIASAFYVSLVPEADAQKLTRVSTADQRHNGAFDLLNRVHNEKINAWYLARQHGNIGFHLYLTKPIKSADLAGLKLRVTPVYRDFFGALGATTVTTAPGVVEGYGWPSVGIFDMAWNERTKYRVDPAFYAVDVAVLVNLAKWKSLDAQQQKLLTDAALWLEGLDRENVALVAAEKERQAQSGIQVIRLEGVEAKRYLDTAYKVGWDSVARASPANAARLRALLDPQ
jgi:TRAP-type C4-dicarboxylate transport system substrate-binding protein